VNLLTGTGLTAGDSSTVHIYKQTCTVQHNETEYTEQYITIRIYKHNNKNI
jgi:hypothetical protein